MSSEPFWNSASVFTEYVHSMFCRVVLQDIMRITLSSGGGSIGSDSGSSDQCLMMISISVISVLQ